MALKSLNLKISSHPGAGDFRTNDVTCKTKDGRTVIFCPTEQLPGAFFLFADNVQRALEIIKNESNNRDALSLAKFLSFVWVGLITLHPFHDGNGRTARAYIASVLNSLQLPTELPSALETTLLEGDVSIEMRKLIDAFYHQLKPRIAS